MARMPDEIALSDNPSAHRFELRLAGDVAAVSEYNLLSHAILFTHTEVQPTHEGKGLGSKLAKFALDETRRRGMKAIPACPFIAEYIRRHHEYLDLVSEESRRAFKV
jgi:hypothetical protein